MAIHFTAASVDHLTTALPASQAVPVSMSCWFNPSSSSASQELIALSNLNLNDAFRLLIDWDNDYGAGAGRVVAVARDTAGSEEAAKTSQAATTSTWQHACAVFYSNGYRQAFINGGNGGGNANGKTVAAVPSVSIGDYNASGSGQFNLMDGEIAECAVWATDISDDEVSILGRGYSPLMVRPSLLLFYTPLIRNIIELRRGASITITGTTVQPHPRVIYPCNGSRIKGKGFLFLTPDADSIDGGWTDDLGGTSLFSRIDESEPADDDDYIRSSTLSGSDDICKIRLSDPTNTPGAPLEVAYRYCKSGEHSNEREVDLNVALLQGSTTKASWDHFFISETLFNAVKRLTSAELATISDFNDLYLQFTARLSTFTPADYGSDLVAWYKADAGVYNDAGATLATTDQTVQQWNDQSGSGFHISQATSGQRPVFTTMGFNGRPTVTLSTTTNTAMTSGAGKDITSTAMSVFVVTQMNSATDNVGRCVAFDPDSANTDSNGVDGFALARTSGEERISFNQFSSVRISVPLGTPLRAGFVSSTSGIDAYINGASYGHEPNNPSFTTGQFNIGAINDVGDDGWDGPISEIVVVKRVLTSVELEQLDAYLKFRWFPDEVSPLTIFGTELVAWYSADFGVYNDAGSTLATDGQTVQQWNDRSGHGYHISQATGGLRPTYDTTGLAGAKKAVVFSGDPTLDHLLTAEDAMTINSSAISVFTVLQMSNNTSSFGRSVAFKRSSQANDYDNAESWTSARSSGTNAISANCNTGGGTGSIAISLDTTYRWGFIFDGSQTQKAYLNNVETIGSSPSSPVNLTVGKFVVGREASITGQCWTGPISEVVIVKRAISPAERDALDAYFTSRWS